MELVHEDGDAPVLGTLQPVDQTPTQPIQEGLEDLDPGSTQHTADKEELVSGMCHPAGDEVRLLDEKEARNRLPASCEGRGQPRREHDTGAGTSIVQNTGCPDDGNSPSVTTSAAPAHRRKRLARHPDSGLDHQLPFTPGDHVSRSRPEGKRTFQERSPIETQLPDASERTFQMDPPDVPENSEGRRVKPARGV